MVHLFRPSDKTSECLNKFLERFRENSSSQEFLERFQIPKKFHPSVAGVARENSASFRGGRGSPVSVRTKERLQHSSSAGPTARPHPHPNRSDVLRNAEKVLQNAENLLRRAEDMNLPASHGPGMIGGPTGYGLPTPRSGGRVVPPNLGASSTLGASASSTPNLVPSNVQFHPHVGPASAQSDHDTPPGPAPYTNSSTASGTRQPPLNQLLQPPLTAGAPAAQTSLPMPVGIQHGPLGRLGGPGLGRLGGASSSRSEVLVHTGRSSASASSIGAQNIESIPPLFKTSSVLSPVKFGRPSELFRGLGPATGTATGTARAERERGETRPGTARTPRAQQAGGPQEGKQGQSRWCIVFFPGLAKKTFWCLRGDALEK